MQADLTSGLTVRNLREWDKAEVLANTVFMPHSLAPVADPRGLDLELRAADLGVARIGFLRHGTAIIARCTEFDGYQINIPLEGMFFNQTGGNRVSCAVGGGTVFSHLQGSTIRTRDDTEAIGLTFDPGNLEHVLGKLMGRTVTSRIEFEPWLDLRYGRGAALLRTVRSVHELVCHDHAPPQLVLAQLGTVIATDLLLGTAHSYTAILQGEPAAAGHASLELAIEAIEADPARPWSLADLAQTSLCSGRALQAAFRQHLGTTPLGYVREIRLKRVRLELAEPAGRSISRIASDCGFTHLGRFSGIYRDRYGVLPSEDYGRSLRVRSR